MEPRVSERFSALTPTTIAYISGDNTIFRVERAKVSRAADLMPVSDVCPLNEPGQPVKSTRPIHLPESDAVLKLLFRFVYCELDIALDKILYLIVVELTEAADKYMVHSARSACHQYMRIQCEDDPLGVAAYAVKHGCDDLLDLAMPYTVGSDLATVECYLPRSHVLPWVRTFCTHISHMLTSRTSAHYNSRFQTIMHNVMNVWIPPRGHAQEVDAEEEEIDVDDADRTCQLGALADGT